MRATGIVRRIDSLGRVVIPREIRKKFGIEDGGSFEIFVDNDEIILRKYPASAGLRELVNKLDDAFSEAGKYMDAQTANRVYEHISALRDILNDVHDKEKRQ